MGVFCNSLHHIILTCKTHGPSHHYPVSNTAKAMLAAHLGRPGAQAPPRWLCTLCGEERKPHNTSDADLTLIREQDSRLAAMALIADQS